MNLKIYRCKECGKRLAPWTPMCDNCKRLTPAVYVLGSLAIVPGMYLLLWFLRWVLDAPPGW